jgi:hypothetical protein
MDKKNKPNPKVDLIVDKDTWGGSFPVSYEEALACAKVMAGIAVDLDATPEDLDLVLSRLNIKEQISSKKV